MTIYVDYIFFINFLFDLILLYGINIILKRNASRTRLLLGSIFGGFTIFILFISINGFIYFFIKILLGVIMLLITFSFKSFKYTFTNFIYLILLSIILGGSLFFINNQLGNKSTGVILFTNGFNLNNIIVLLGSLLIIELYSYINKVYKNNVSNIYSVVLYNKDQVLKLNGYLDTGNNLYDPYFNKPIIILNKGISILYDSFIMVPYNTISGEGLMKCIFCDKLYINDIGYKYNVLIGLSNDKFHLYDTDIILHKEMIE